MTWRQLTPEEAKAHPAYGVKGWMLAIGIIVALIALFSFLAPFFSPTTKAFSAWPFFSQLMFVMQVAAAGVLAVAIFTKNDAVINALHAIILVQVLYIIGLIVGLHDPLALEDLSRFNRTQRAFLRSQQSTPLLVIGQLIGLAIWGAALWYFSTRERPNVTIFHRVKAEAS